MTHAASPFRRPDAQHSSGAAAVPSGAPAPSGASPYRRPDASSSDSDTEIIEPVVIGPADTLGDTLFGDPVGDDPVAGGTLAGGSLAGGARTGGAGGGGFHFADEPEISALSNVSALSDEPDLLAQPPLDDDLSERLGRAAPRRLANRATYVLAGLALVVVGFVAGAQVQKSYGTAPAAAGPGGVNPAAIASAFANRGQGNGGQGFPGGGGQGFAGGSGSGGGTRGGITGTVKLVDGTTVYIETADGNTVIVKTSDKTTVSTPGALRDLTAGSTVTVQGQNANGSVTATSITKTK